ncbi:MAG: diaminopimelate dehydrogenase [Clostridiales bacterium]|nr:diaminopimelate dehydrogenase [Clostridiales bacterium]
MKRVGIMGYGNLGRGVECALKHSRDMKLKAVFTRRNPDSIDVKTEGVSVVSAADADKWQGEIDVMILCGGSATDLRGQSVEYGGMFNIVDSFDSHGDIVRHFKDVDRAAVNGGKLAVISAGWDPGLFSLARVYGQAVLPEGQSQTFWGKGLSQGHSDAIRRIDGVVDARQYTIPLEEAVKKAREGKASHLTAGEKHRRQCFVVAREGADRDRIRAEIISMPNYFVDYETIVEFITEAELVRDHSSMAHGGFVIRTGRSGWELQEKNVIEYKLDLESNPEFTGSVLTAVARAVCVMAGEGQRGCRSMLDIPPSYLLPQTREELLSSIM